MDNRSIVQGMMVRVGLGVFGLLTLATIVLTLISDRGLLEVRRKGLEFAELQVQIETLETENIELVKEIRNLRSEPSEIERRAREELKLVRPGEVILVLPPKDR
jgi:cell division protein FtsB